jgi:hypothetical protein
VKRQIPDFFGSISGHRFKKNPGNESWIKYGIFCPECVTGCIEDVPEYAIDICSFTGFDDIRQVPEKICGDDSSGH